MFLLAELSIHRRWKIYQSVRHCTSFQRKRVFLITRPCSPTTLVETFGRGFEPRNRSLFFSVASVGRTRVSHCLFLFFASTHEKMLLKVAETDLNNTLLYGRPERWEITRKKRRKRSVLRSASRVLKAPVSLTG